MTPATGLLLAEFLCAAALTAVLIALFQPLLRRYALARPNARSSHTEPTPQGGGLAAIAAIVIVLAVTVSFAPTTFGNEFNLTTVAACVVGLAILGATDDIWPLEPVPRLLLQAAAVLGALMTLPDTVRILPMLPWWVERALAAFAVLWLINVVNFMDGIDWMTVAEVIPITVGLTLFGYLGFLPAEATFVSAALCGAMIGFAPFNRPVARLFLGDVGSLPIGLILGWILVLLAGSGHLIAAILLPLYYLADATITLLLRIFRREKIMEAHRSHFYQQAMDGGLSVYEIVGRVFALNIALVGLAAVTVIYNSPVVQITSIATGAGFVALLLLNFKSWRRQETVPFVAK